MADIPYSVDGQDPKDKINTIIDQINGMGGDDLENGVLTSLAGPQISFSVGSESGNKIQITCQMEQSDGTDITTEAFFAAAWLADSATGGETATAPDTGFTVDTGVQVSVQTADKFLFVLSDATGTLVIDVDETGADTWYLRLAVGGRVWTSGAITFT